LNEYKNDVYGVFVDESWSNNYRFNNCRVYENFLGGVQRWKS